MLWVIMLRLLIVVSILQSSPLVALSNAHFSSTSSQQRQTFAAVERSEEWSVVSEGGKRRSTWVKLGGGGEGQAY